MNPAEKKQRFCAGDGDIVDRSANSQTADISSWEKQGGYNMAVGCDNQFTILWREGGKNHSLRPGMDWRIKVEKPGGSDPG